jgi:hypothetical protein
MNVYGHQDIDHDLVAGDVKHTAWEYFNEHQEAVVAFAYFDIGDYEATRAAMHAIQPRLVPGSILLLDQFTWAGAPGEAVAFREAFGKRGYTIEKCALYPSKAIVTIK